MKSMTGFGHGLAECDNKKVSIDLKSVNGRFLDVSIKMPKSFLSLEDLIKTQIKSELARGTVDVFVTITKGSEDSFEVSLNGQLCQSVYAEAESLSRSSGIPNGLTIKDLMRIDGVLNLETKELDVSEYDTLISSALAQALSALGLMRETEGLNLQRDLADKINHLRAVVDKIAYSVPESLASYKEKLTQRITETLNGIEIDESKLINEVAFFIDKSDVNEEVTRLYSHIEQFIELLNSQGPVGKQLEFISQEITREINTTGSKSGSIVITNLVLDAKNINESIKEQIRNVE